MDNKEQFNPKFTDLNRKFKYYVTDSEEKFDAIDIVIIYSEYNTLKYCLENYPDSFKNKDINKLHQSVRVELYLNFYKIKFGKPIEQMDMVLKMLNHRDKWISDI